jgi:hypothetical protein
MNECVWGICGMILTGETEMLGEKHYSPLVVGEWSNRGMILTEETELLGETCPSTTLFSKSRTWTDPASSLGQSEGSVTNRLSHSSVAGIY